MSVALYDLKFYASATVAEDDVTTQIGGAILTSKKFDFTNVAGTLQGVSDSGGDTTQSITVTYRDSAGVLQTLVIALNGTAVVTNGTSVSRIEKAVKSATCAGNVAVEGQTAVRTGTCQSGSTPSTAVLDAGASAVDGAYTTKIFRTTGGTGAGQIRQIIDYVGATKTCTLSQPFAAAIDSTTTFRISDGVFFDKLPAEITYVVRIEYSSAANAPGGGPVTFYTKGFFKNTGVTSTLSAAVVKEYADPAADVAFGLDLTVGASTDNGGGNNRKVAPAGITFDSADKNVPGGTQSLGPGSFIGVWIALVLADGNPPVDSTWTPLLQGSTS